MSTKTADGIEVKVGDTVYEAVIKGVPAMAIKSIRTCTPGRFFYNEYCTARLSDCYSTRYAAAKSRIQILSARIDKMNAEKHQLYKIEAGGK